MSSMISLLPALVLGVAGAQEHANPSIPVYTSDTSVWPNSFSHANSDPWIVINHDRIKKMEPRVLVLNFVNGFSMDDAHKIASHLCEALTEATRFHGYKDPKAKPFVEWKLLKIIDLSDPKPYPKTPDHNGTKYPRAALQGMNFAYKELYGEKFAEYYGYKDPDNPKRFLRLNELVARGIIHELWFFAAQENAGAPFECTELKPVYDENFRRIPEEHRHSGNGGDPAEPWFGRSLRIDFINYQRGIGCSLESMSHSMEGMAHSGVIPYYHKYFYEFASFDIDKRWGLPWNSLYAVGGEGNGVTYPDAHTAVITQDKKTYRLENYYVIGGNVHWTPNGRSQYDLTSPFPVMSTIEHWRMHDGPDGKDKAEPWTVDKYKQYLEFASDGMGPWLMYWRQNMPNYHSQMKDDDGKPMKNWWPFLYY